MSTPMTSQQILDKVLAESIAPLPSQAGYAKALAEIFSLHLRKNILMDDGFSPDELPSLSSLVVAPTGQGKTFLLRKMTECLGINLITVDCSTPVAENYNSNILRPCEWGKITKLLIKRNVEDIKKTYGLSND